MTNKAIVVGIIGVVIVGAVVVALTSGSHRQLASEESEKSGMMKNDNFKEPVMIKKASSSYVDYSPQVLTDAEAAQKDGQKVVLFFGASWCSFCREADKDFKTTIGTDKFPAHLTLIKVDYDSQTELKKKYGVTSQHTFVQIDSNGNQITKWISGDTAVLSEQIK